MSELMLMIHSMKKISMKVRMSPKLLKTRFQILKLPDLTGLPLSRGVPLKEKILVLNEEKGSLCGLSQLNLVLVTTFLQEHTFSYQISNQELRCLKCSASLYPKLIEIYF
jgi:hypothetical protein